MTRAGWKQTCGEEHRQRQERCCHCSHVDSAALSRQPATLVPTCTATPPAGEQPVRGHMREVRVPEECPPEAAHLMAECGALDPAARPSAQQVMRRLAALLEALRRSHQQE